MYLGGETMKKSFWFAVILIMLSVFVLSACSPDAEEIDWVNIKLGHVLPEPQSNLMKILSNDDDIRTCCCKTKYFL